MPDSELFEYFIGPRGENMPLLEKMLAEGLKHYRLWRQHFFHDEPSVYRQELLGNEPSEKFRRAFRELLVRLAEQPPYFHPRYAAQMLKDPALPAALAYFFTMLTNPNNHAYEGGPVTTEMELEVIEQLQRMVGFSAGWGHLTSGGTLANLEALWAVRDGGRRGKVFFSAGSHYSWKRLSRICGIDDCKEIPVDANYRIDLQVLEDELRRSPTSLIVANLGTTGCGAVDNLPALLALRDKYGFHLHVDAAYGGFTRAVMLDENANVDSDTTSLSSHTRESLVRLGEVDSITIDPHKHGLSSYGAGAVIFRDEKFRQVILNTAPYTYHVTDKPNIGMFSLEGSRPGAAAAACWLTYRVLPLHRHGLGKIIQRTLQTAQEFARRLDKGYRVLCPPDLDIVCFYPRHDHTTRLSEINQQAAEIYGQLNIENLQAPFFLSKFIIDSDTARRVIPDGEIDAAEFMTLRAVFVKHWMLEGPVPTYLDRLLEVLQRSTRK